MGTLLRTRLDFLFDGDVEWRSRLHHLVVRKMCGVSSYCLKQPFTKNSYFVCGDSLPECSWTAGNSVMHVPQYLCLQKAYAVVNKKHGTFSQTEDSDIASMEAWALDKPAGFGADKVYDTSLEERILEEINRDKAGQAAALLKRGRKIQQKEQTNKTKVKAEFKCQPGVVEVGVSKLPKKKNVERDLQLAYKNVSGLIHIKPSVQGNEKTRDPICKGFGSLFFGNISSAKSFVSSFGDEFIRFGNVQRKLSYKIANDSHSANDIPLRVQETNKAQTLDSAFRTGLQRKSTSSSMFDIESPENGMAEIQSSYGTWKEDNTAHDDTVDVESPEKIKESCNALKISPKTTVTKMVGDINFVNACYNTCDESNGEGQQDLPANMVFPSQKHHLYHVSADSRDILYEDSAAFANGDQCASSMVDDASLQENCSSTVAVPELRKQEQKNGPLSDAEERIEALEKRLLSKMKAAELELKENNSRLLQKKSGFKPSKSKRSKQTLGSSLGSAGRLKKKERKFITDTLQKYGGQECMPQS